MLFCALGKSTKFVSIFQVSFEAFEASYGPTTGQEEVHFQVELCGLYNLMMQDSSCSSEQFVMNLATLYFLVVLDRVPSKIGETLELGNGYVTGF